MAKHDIPLSEIYGERWTYDIQPPLFYFSAWLFEPITGENIAARRLVNFLWIALAAIGFAALARRSPGSRDFLKIFAILIASNPFVWDLLAEHRSYAAQIAAVSLLFAALMTLIKDGKDYTAAHRPTLTIITFAMLVASNLHYLTSAILGIPLLNTIIFFWMRGKRRWALRLFLVCVLSYLALAVSALAQLTRVNVVYQNFWATTTVWEALRAITFVLGCAIFANVLAILSLCTSLIQTSRLRRIDLNARDVLLLTLSSIALTLVFVITLNYFKPVLMPRYLTPVAIMPIAALAFVLADRSVTRPWLNLILINALVLVGGMTFVKSVAKKSNKLASVIGQAAKACPSTQVIAIPHWVARSDKMYVMVNEPDVVALGYHVLGKQYGFRPSTGSVPTTLGKSCPSIVWSEHYFGPPPRFDTVARLAKLRLPKANLFQVQLEQSSTGFMIVYRPISQ